MPLHDGLQVREEKIHELLVDFRVVPHGFEEVVDGNEEGLHVGAFGVKQFCNYNAIG